MARVKRSRTSAAGSRKRGRYGRKGRMGRIKDVGSMIHRFSRMYDSGTFVGNATTGAPLLKGASFNLNNIPNVGEFTALFDQYMITHVQLRFHLQVDPSAQASASAVYPKIYTATDFDDDGAPATLNAIREHARCKVRVLNPNRPVVVNIKPAINTLVYRGITTSSYSPQWRKWIDCAQTDVPHFGLKWAVDNFTNTNYTLQVEGKMWFACKDVR